MTKKMQKAGGPAELPTLPVKGYKTQGQDRVDLVNVNKEREEQALRTIDALMERDDVDKRWLAIGRTQMEQAWMAINRAVFKPERVSLPGDKKLNQP